MTAAQSSNASQQLLVTEARRLAAADIGPLPWARQLAVTVQTASSDDLGIMVVARAVLTKVVEDAAAQAARDRAAAEERQRTELREEARRVAQEARLRRARRRSRLVGQIAARITISGIYYAAVALTVARGSRFGWSAALPVLVACLVAVATTVTIDWFRDNRGGTLRRLSVTVGVLVGAADWLNFLSAGSPFNDITTMSTMPWSVGIAWVVGSLLDSTFDRLTRRHSDGISSYGVNRARNWLFILTALGTLVGISALFFPNCYGTCTATQGAWRLVQRVGYLHIDPLGLGTSATATLVLAVIITFLYALAPRLARMSRPLGILAVVVGPLLGLALVFAYSPNIVTVVIASVAR